MSNITMTSEQLQSAIAQAVAATLQQMQQQGQMQQQPIEQYPQRPQRDLRNSARIERRNEARQEYREHVATLPVNANGRVGQRDDKPMVQRNHHIALDRELNSEEIAAIGRDGIQQGWINTIRIWPDEQGVKAYITVPMRDNPDAPKIPTDDQFFVVHIPDFREAAKNLKFAQAVPFFKGGFVSVGGQKIGVGMTFVVENLSMRGHFSDGKQTVITLPIMRFFVQEEIAVPVIETMFEEAHKGEKGDPYQVIHDIMLPDELTGTIPGAHLFDDPKYGNADREWLYARILVARRGGTSDPWAVSDVMLQKCDMKQRFSEGETFRQVNIRRANSFDSLLEFRYQRDENKKRAVANAAARAANRGYGRQQQAPVAPRMTLPAPAPMPVGFGRPAAAVLPAPQSVEDIDMAEIDAALDGNTATVNDATPVQPQRRGRGRQQTAIF